MPYGRKMRDWRGNMTKRDFSRKDKILILVLAYAMLGTALFGICASAAATDHAVNGFSYKNLTATIAYDESGGAVTATGSNNSITVEVRAKENTTGGWFSKKYTYAQQSSVLSIKNDADAAQEITYTIKATPNSSGGLVDKASGTGYKVTIPAGGVFSISAQSGQNSTENKNPQSDCYATTYTITITDAKQVTVKTKVEFQEVALLGKAVPGSYSVTVGANTLAVPGTHTNDINTKYTLTAQANGDFVFKGWYVNGVKVSEENPLTTNFAEATNTVVARFGGDALLDKISLSDTDSSGAAVDSNLTKYDFVEATCIYTPTDYIKTQPSPGAQPSATGGYGTLYTGPHGKEANQYEWHFYEDPAWKESSDAALQSVSNGTAKSEYCAIPNKIAEDVNGYAIVNSPVLRIKALEDIKLTFDYNVSITESKDSRVDKATKSKSYLYYYIGTNESATRKNIVDAKQNIATDGAASSSGTGYEISIPKGQYLYLYSYGYFHEAKFVTIVGKGDAKSFPYSYTSTISNLKVTPVNERYTIQAGFQDNTGLSLGAGKVRIKDAAANKDYTIGTTGVTTGNYENVAGTNVTLSVVTPPSGYTHIGWRDETAGTTVHTATYSFTLSSDRTVYALFAPAMTITMGSNGYSDATYEYKPLNSSSMTTQNGQYVARNSNGSVFYTTLAEAFGATDTVVLLAGDTFNGDFTVPEGKTLVVPYGLDDDGSTTPDQITTGYAGLSNYVTVTVNGNMTVDGTLVVSGRQYAGTNGRPGGPIGRLVVAAGANIVVKGTLDAFGAVGGDGHIEVNSNASVYELMEIRDLRGINELYSVYKGKDSYGVFLFNSYFVKNIEAETSYNAGARGYAHYSVVVQGQHSYGDVPIIGTSNDKHKMFAVVSGSLTKKYDRTSDRTIFRVDENSTAKTGNFSVKMTVTIGIPVDISVNTADYLLPMPYGYEFEVAGNLDITKNSTTGSDGFKMLPGSMINVKESGTLTVSGSLVFYRLNDYDTQGPGTDKAQGFSSAGYPVTPTRLPTPGAKYPTINKTTIGSAKLNVDGTMIVNGGVYVTNGTSESSLFSTYDNGYNNLTGTGTITINKVGTLSSFYEAQQQKGINDVTFTKVPISSLKALPYDAEVDTPESYKLTFEKTTYYGYINSKGLSTWSTQKPVTLTYDANGGTGSIEPTRVPSGAKATVAANNRNIRFGDYKFTGWKDKDGNTYAEGQIIETLTEDLTLYAQWEKTFTVTWLDWNGTELERDEKVTEGSTPSYDGETPTRAETEDIIYTFTGWDKELVPVTRDIEYKAVYSELHKNVKLIHADGTVGYYETVSAAVNASRAGETVMLLKNRTEPMIRIAQGKDLILNLNGKKITSESGSAIENNGTISITGSGTVSAASSGSAILNNGTIESISDGTFIGADVAGSGLLIAQGSKVVTISGGTFQGQYGITVAGTLDTISNAALTGTSNGLYVVNGGTVNTVSGGTFTGGSIGLSVSNTGTVKTISGGTFVSTGAGGFAVKSSSGTAIEFAASGSPDSGNYNGPLFKSAAGTRAGTVDSPDSAKFTYPTGMTVSGKANTNGYFYIGANVFTIKFAPNDTTDEKVEDSTVVPDWTVDLSATEDINVPTARFTRKGYIFQGWGVKNADGTEKIIIDEKATTVPLATLKGAWDPTPAVGDEVTLYAIWKPDKVYSVTVSWSKGLEYTYIPNEYTWNATEMRYEHTREAGWIGAKDSRNPTVTISNGGEKTDVTYGHINADIQYTPKAEAYNGFTMDFLVDNMSVGKGSATLATKLAPKNSVTAAMKLEGTPFIGMDMGKPITIGTVALTLTTAD